MSSSFHFTSFLSSLPICTLPNSKTGFHDTWMIREKILLSHCSLSGLGAGGDREINRARNHVGSVLSPCRQGSGAEGKQGLTRSKASEDGNGLGKHPEKDLREPLDIFDSYKGRKRTNTRSVERLLGRWLQIILKSVHDVPTGLAQWMFQLSILLSLPSSL